MKYRKKPVTIEAYQTDVEMDIPTLEGTMHASIGDYIITGVHGEQYPCKPDIFIETYEPADGNDAATLGDVPRLPYFWTADGTLHVELPRLPESISVRLPEQRDHREVSSARVWQYTRGSGTCHMEYCDEWSGNELYPTEAYVCSACGCITVDGKPNHCPNCGAKAVDE